MPPSSLNNPPAPAGFVPAGLFVSCLRNNPQKNFSARMEGRLLIEESAGGCLYG